MKKISERNSQSCRRRGAHKKQKLVPTIIDGERRSIPIRRRPPHRHILKQKKNRNVFTHTVFFFTLSRFLQGNKKKRNRKCFLFFCYLFICQEWFLLLHSQLYIYFYMCELMSCVSVACCRGLPCRTPGVSFLLRTNECVKAIVSSSLEMSKKKSNGF